MNVFKLKKSLWYVKKHVYLPRNTAKVAQLVERQPSKLNVASSNLVFRSKLYPRIEFFFDCIPNHRNLENKIYTYLLFVCKKTSNSIGIASRNTVNVFCTINSGTNKSVTTKPPIAPPRCAACPIVPPPFCIP